jgi:hypothetical protein
MRMVKSAIVAASVCAAMLTVTVPAASAAGAGLPTTSVTPNPAAPGTVTTFEVFCGGEAESATLFGATLGLADLILMHGAARAHDFDVTVTLPTGIRPGTYHPAVDCSNGVAGSATLRVNPVPGQAPQTGDGTTATETGSPLAPIGYWLMGLGVITGAVAIAIRRRPAPRH